jgi:phosphatidylserine decarboxylase
VNSHSLIARQGVLPFMLALLAAVLVLHLGGLIQSLGFWALAALVLVLFRDPDRTIPSLPMSALSPADGKILDVGKVHDPYLDRDSVRVAVNMSPYGVYTTRSPIEGKVLEPPRLTGDGRNPHGVWLQTDEGDDIVLVMNKGRLHNNPQCYVRFGDRIGQGKRCGFVHMGGRVDIYLPANSIPTVATGDPVRAGLDAIAKLVHT